MSFRTTLFVINGLFLLGLVLFFGYRYLSLRRNPEPGKPSNLTPFFSDDDLEGPRLERVLGWSLIFVAASVVALLVYFLVEPVREVAAKDQFKTESIARGATLFANSQSVHYDATKSLLCANCHGADAKGGSAPFVLQPEADKCLAKENQSNPAVPECLPKQVSWQAPDLTLAALRYSRDQLTEIITYGRPGTPMPSWGVASGKGVLEAQGIEDLVNYLESVKTTAAKAQAAAAASITKYKQDATDLVATDTKALQTAQDALAKGKADSTSTAAVLTSLQQAVTTAQSDLAEATAEAAEAKQLTDGAILFRLNCARCHTKGWSYHVTQPDRSDLPTLSAQGSGAYGPNLTNGDTVNQFPGQAGVQQQFDWIALGVPANNQYGARGISSGRMPHFGQVLTEDQIKAIVAYERSL